MSKLRILRWIALSYCVAGPLACDRGGTEATKSEGEGKGAGTPADAESTEKKSAEAAVEGAVERAEQEAGAAALFDPEDKAFRKRACEFLTADMVAEAFEVPVAELTQRKLLGCMYTWESGGQIVDAKVMTPRVHKTLDRAQKWFDNVTATKTNEQLGAELDKVKTAAQEHESIDTAAKKKVAGDVTEFAKLATPDEGVSYADVPGIGDQARVSSADGVLWVRLGNMTFQVTGYKGPDQPKFEIDPTNPKAIAKKSLEVQKKWIADTIEQRKAGSAKLAPAVVEAIRALSSP